MRGVGYAEPVLRFIAGIPRDQKLDGRKFLHANPHVRGDGNGSCHDGNEEAQ